MKNFNKFLLFNYIIYISVFILIFIFGLTGVFAASYTGFDYSAQLYDNVNGNLTAVTTGGPAAATGLYEGYIAYTANSSGGAWGISSPTTLLSNHTYTLTASIPNECSNLVLSTHNRIGVGTTLANAKSSYQNNSNVDEVYSKVIGGDNFLIQFAFTPRINGSFIVFPYATSNSCSSTRTILESISIEDLGINGATQEDINNSLNQQTIEINTTINNLGTDIKDGIKDTFEDCRPSKNLFPLPENQTLNGLTYTKNSDGTFNISGTSTAYTEFSVWKNYNDVNIDLTNNDYYFLSNNTSASQTLVYQISTWNGSPSSASWVNTPYQSASSGLVNTGYNNVGSLIRFTLSIDSGKTVNFQNVKVMLSESSTALNWEAYGVEICQNKIDETNDKLDQTNQQLGELNSNLNNSNSSGATNDASNFFSNFTTDTFGLTSIITSPLSLINTITSSSCSSLRLPLPYLDNKFLELPCMNSIYSRYFGSFFNLYQTITFGIVAYWVIVRIFNQVKDFKNPDHDEIEVLDL